MGKKLSKIIAEPSAEKPKQSSTQADAKSQDTDSSYKRADYVADVRKFHIAFKHPAPESPQYGFPSNDLCSLRKELILEETLEAISALSGKDVDRIALADALCDIIYVTAGAAVVAGLQELTTYPYVASVDKQEPWKAWHCIKILWAFAAAAINTIDCKPFSAWSIDLSELIYRCETVAKSYDIPLKECFDEVVRSNMSKLWPGGVAKLQESGPKKGKVIKSPNWTPPNLAAIIERYK